MRHRVQQAVAMLHDNAELRGCAYGASYINLRPQNGFSDGFRRLKSHFAVNVMESNENQLQLFSFAGYQVVGRVNALVEL